MSRVVKLATRHILRDALASAIVTIVVTAAFTGFASRSEPPVPVGLVGLAAGGEPKPADLRADVAAATPAPAAAEYSRAWFDPKAAAPNPTGFRRAAASPVARAVHRRPAVRPSVAPARLIVQVVAHGDDKLPGHGGHAPDALAITAPAFAKRGFRVWGVAPSDLIPSIPSASSIMKGVKSVGTSVAGLMPSL